MSSAVIPNAVAPSTKYFVSWSNRSSTAGNGIVCISADTLTTCRRKNATHFDPDDAPPHLRPYYRRLDLHNRDAYVGREDTRVWEKVDREYHHALIEGMSVQLELNKKQRAFADHLYHGVDRQKIGMVSELTGFCCCALALRVGGSSREYRPERNDENNDPVFVNMADWLQTRFNRKKTHIQSVMNKIDYEHL